LGRPSIRKKGAMTAAERQRRHRRKLRAARRAAEMAEQRVVNSARARQPRDAGWTQALPIIPVAGLPGPADELARQIGEYLAERSDLTIDDVRDAIDRRFGAQLLPQ